MNDTKKPVHEIRIRGIKAAIFAHENENGVQYRIIKKRTYRVAEDKRKKGDNGWRETEYLSPDDLLLENHINTLAFQWVLEAQAAAKQIKQNEFAYRDTKH